VLSTQYDPALFTGDDTLCLWGDFQADFDRGRMKGSNARIVVTGHPRFELYKPKWNSFYEDKTKEITSKYGKYILVSGNYGTANHGLGVKHVFTDAGDYLVNDVSKRLAKVGLYTYSSKQMVSIIELTHVLAAEFPEFNFVFRPHPSEDHNYYKCIFNGVKNIHVVHDGPVGPWILGAKLLLHDGCTTAIEAALADIPVINFKPLHNERFDVYLPNQIGRRATTIDDVKSYVKQLQTSSLENDLAYRQTTSHLFANFKLDSLEMVKSVIIEESSKLFKPPQQPSMSAFRTEYTIP
jgi:surface carbohydrate biosynthesis protein